VKVEFAVAGTAGSFERNSVTGRAVLRLGADTVTLQSPWNPFTHLRVSPDKTWTAQMGGHQFVVGMERARMLGGIREAEYTVVVDGEEIARQRGL
jgi:hypothetical protein